MNIFAAADEQVGVFIFAGAVVTGFIAVLISVASSFSPRRDVDNLEARVKRLEEKVGD